jgi:hypothetical protein
MRGIDVVDVRSFYDPAPFEEFRKESPLDGLFRAGFWLKAVERFFLLDQFLAHQKLERFFHAELDVLFFDLAGLAEALDSYGRGCFIPAQRHGRAIASLIYINQADALTELVNFLHENRHLGNEMNILGHFLAERPGQGHALPSESLLDGTTWPVTPSSVPPEVGMVDALTFGPWVFGYDPRNVLGSSWNHFRENPKGIDMTAVRFSSDFSAKNVWVESGVRRWQLRTMHVHAKVFGRLRLPGMIWVYLKLAGAPFSVPITFSAGRITSKLLTGALSRSSGKRLSQLPGPIKSLFTKSLIGLVSASPKIISERERAIVISLLPRNPLGFSEAVPLIKHVSSLAQVSLDAVVGELLLRVDPRKRTGFISEISLLLDALNGNDPVVYSYLQNPNLGNRLLVNRKKQVLFVSKDKRYLDSKHALTFWNERNLSNRWSFVSPAQVIQPRVVREMFPNGEEDVFSWAKLSLIQPRPSLSVFQSYGTWLSSQSKYRFVFAQY